MSFASTCRTRRTTGCARSPSRSAKFPPSLNHEVALLLDTQGPAIRTGDRRQALRPADRRLGQLHRQGPEGHRADHASTCNYPLPRRGHRGRQHRHRRQRPAAHAGDREARQRTRLRGAHARPDGQPPPHQPARRRREAARADREGLRRHRARLRVRDGLHRHVVRAPRRRHRAAARENQGDATATSASWPRSRTRSR